MSAATIIADAYGEDANLYTDVLEVTADATAAQLRKAYYRKALQCHPDKSSDPADPQKFQALAVAYEILKDPVKRQEYDDTGEFMEGEEETSATSSSMWTDYFTHVFGKVSTNQIDQFAQKYKCSDEEEQDVLKYYKQFTGNLHKMLDHVMLSTELDCARWVEDFITPAVDEGRVPDYMSKVKQTLKKIPSNADNATTKEKIASKRKSKKATGKSKPKPKQEEEEDIVIDEDATESEEDDDDMKPPRKQPSTKKKSQKAPPNKKQTTSKTKRLTKAEREAAEAQALMDKIRNKGTVAHRKAGFDSMLSGIKNRYGVMKDDPLADEDEFQQIQAKLESQRRSNQMKKKKNKSKK